MNGFAPRCCTVAIAGFLVVFFFAASGSLAASRSDDCGSSAPPHERSLTGISDGLLECVVRVVSALEYEPRVDDLKVEAANRAHALRTTFLPSGIRVHDWPGGDAAPLMRLSLVRHGRGDELVAVPPGDVRAEGNRVEIARPGIVEWFVNSSRGLEHGANLARRPEGRGDLVLELSVEGSSAALVDDRVIFTTRAGRRFTYDHLVVVDATGRSVPAKMVAPDAGHVRLVVDDGEAAYPLTIDPLLTAAADTRLESADPALGLGVSVAGAGDVNGDGYADVVVGAHKWAGGTNFAGGVFVFHGGPGGLGSAASALPTTMIESDSLLSRFGASVAGAGDVNGDGYADVIVGAPRYENGQFEEGAAFLFLGGPGGVPSGSLATAATRIESNQHYARLGGSVASAGDVNGDGYSDVVVGVPLWTVPGINEGGAALVFHGGPSGIADGDPATADTIIGSDTPGVELGTSVASAGDVNGDGYADVIVGAPLYDNSSINSAGGAFVFHGSATGIADAGPSTAPGRLFGEVIFARLGESVGEAADVNGDGFADVLVAGHRWAYVFHGSTAGVGTGSQSTADTQIEIFDGAQFNSTGWSVDGAGDVDGDGFGDVMIGARRYSAGESQEGVAWLFLGSEVGIVDGDPANAEVQLESNQAGAWFGTSVTGAGDVDGDGFSDVVVGALDYDDGVAEESGAAFLYLGGDDEGLTSPRLRQRRIGSGGGPVEPGGGVFATDRFGIDFFADPMIGMARAKLEVEICAAGFPFGDPQCATSVSPDWVSVEPAGSDLDHTITGLASDVLYTWRARVSYTPTTSGEPATTTPGRWFRLRGRSTPGDIRLVPEPGFGVGVMALLVSTVALASRRIRI